MTDNDFLQDPNEEEFIDENNLLAQALPVVDLKTDVDLSIPASTGHEYLSRYKLFSLFH